MAWWLVVMVVRYWALRYKLLQDIVFWYLEALLRLPTVQGLPLAEQNALLELRSSLNLTAAQLQGLRWDASVPPCTSDCGIDECAWGGIACRCISFTPPCCSCMLWITSAGQSKHTRTEACGPCKGQISSMTQPLFPTSKYTLQVLGNSQKLLLLVQRWSCGGCWSLNFCNYPGSFSAIRTAPTWTQQTETVELLGFQWPFVSSSSGFQRPVLAASKGAKTIGPWRRNL